MSKNELIPVSTFLSRDIIERKIYFFRGQKVMFDRDLAALYEVGTRDLNKAVSRNLDRFPSDFMFQLNQREFKNLMFQFGTSSWGGTRKRPWVFTEHGILMVRRGTDQTNSRDDPAGVQGNALQGDPTYRMPKGSWDNSLLGK